MNVLRILLGVGAVGATAAGIFFGLGVKKEQDKYSVQMTRYRNVATQVKSLIDSNPAIRGTDLVVMDPESEKGGKQWTGLSTYKKDYIVKLIPNDVLNGDGTKFRDGCFEKMEARQGDLKDENISTYFNETSSGTDERVLGPGCVPTSNEVK